METAGQKPQQEVGASDFETIGGKPTPWPREAESSEEFETVQADERHKSHSVCLELCDDIRDVILEIQREITGLFNVPRLKAVEHRYRLMGIYRNMERLYADIADKK